MRWLWIATAIAVAGGWQAWSTRPVRHTAGEIVHVDPVQRSIGSNAPRFRRDDADIVARARFEMEGVVLGRERYRFDRMAKLVPVDIAFGWGPMSDAGVVSKLSITQGNRFYFWSTPEFPIPRRDIE